MEFLFDYGTLLIHLLCLLLFINSRTSLLVVLSHTSTNFLIKRKEKKKKMNNNLAIFGCVMTLRDLIDTGDITAFIDDVLVEIEDEKKYDKIVEEILKRMKANNLYLKSKKCV